MDDILLLIVLCLGKIELVVLTPVYIEFIPNHSFWKFVIKNTDDDSPDETVAIVSTPGICHAHLNMLYRYRMALIDHDT
jgi:hypothetical protein